MDTETIPDDITARRDAERERRIARARAEAQPSATAVALADTGGTGAPPEHTPMETIRLLGQLLYGERWQSDVAADLGLAPRQVRRWVAGEAKPSEKHAEWMRGRARTRAQAIMRLVDRI
ncbi:MAG: hypothetical protein INR70_23370 [Parafilimonas terrae]|nr:hypothetical protein [Parafilimonas terrae]